MFPKGQDELAYALEVLWDEFSRISVWNLALHAESQLRFKPQESWKD